MKDKSLRKSGSEFSASGTTPASGSNLSANTLSEESLRLFHVRSHRAKLMLALIDEIEEAWGQNACALHVQRLKWELAQCYLELGHTESDENFLSIVELIEASLHGQTWTQYNPERLNLLRKVLKSTTEKPHITYEDYRTVRKTFWDAEIETHPGINLFPSRRKKGQDNDEDK